MPETIPPDLHMDTTEQLPLGFDFTPWLAPGQTPGSPTSELLDAAGAPVTLADGPAVNGNVVVQPVRGSALAKHSSYVLAVSAQLAAGHVETMYRRIRTGEV